jgi:hypothetical protein
MKSWAVPKGPSLDPTQRRLAVEVEDHPTEYNTFEGPIPAGEYGGGTVMLWDRGTYEPDEGDVESLRRGYQRGDIKFSFHGKRLQGSFALVRMANRGEEAAVASDQAPRCGRCSGLGHQRVRHVGCQWRTMDEIREGKPRRCGTPLRDPGTGNRERDSE